MVAPLILIPRESRALRTAVAFMTSGEAGGVPQQEVNAAEAAFNKLSDAPDRSLWIGFSRLELAMLWSAINNGAEGVLQSSSGSRADQRTAFRDAANRIAEAGGFGPKF